MGSAITIIIGLLKAIPVLDQWFKSLSLAYYEWKVASHDSAFIDAHRALIEKNDQRKLEEASGMPNAGKPIEDQTDVFHRPNPNAPKP